MSSYSTYILRCADDTLYTGITTDTVRRVQEHNTDDKKGAKYTRVRRPVELVYHEKYLTRSEASKREYEIKQLSRTEKLELIGSSLLIEDYSA
jgi:putative endonuclease